MSKLIEDYKSGVRVVRDGDVLVVDMIYPRSDGHPKAVEVGIECVRAADTVRIEYDFDRDGFSIKQAATRFDFENDDSVCDPDWREVAFVPAWGRAASREQKERVFGAREAVRALLLALPDDDARKEALASTGVCVHCGRESHRDKTGRTDCRCYPDS